MGRYSQLVGSRWDRVAGRWIHSRVSLGDARPGEAPLVFVHGYGVSSSYLMPTITRLAHYYRVYAPDLPGFGKSDHPRTVLNAPELADALAAWMGVVGLSGVVLVGNSFGCQVIAHLVARHPACAARVVLTSPTLDIKARPLPQLFWRFARDIPNESPSLVAVFTRAYLACGPWRAVRTFHYLRRDYIERYLPFVRVPTLIVCGARDPLAPPRWGEELARILPRGRLVVLPRAPHALPYSAPRALVRAIRAFLRETDAVDRPAPPRAAAASAAAASDGVASDGVASDGVARSTRTSGEVVRGH